MTSCARNPAKSWINASAIDRVDAVSYFMKHSTDDSVSLRQELSILSQISTDHPNLLYFQGIATKESHVIAVLFEPIRGGSLRGYLAEVRATLEGRSPTSSSSGYEGSDKESVFFISCGENGQIPVLLIINNWIDSPHCSAAFLVKCPVVWYVFFPRDL